MAPIKAALLGFGTVGQGVYEALKTHREQLKSALGEEVVIEAILVKDGAKKRDVDEHILVTTDFDEILNIPDLQIVFEAIVGEEPGYTYLSKAIEKGCHVITANKVMFARHGKTLLNKAEEAGVSVGFEATTAGGTPIIRSISQLLQVNDILSVEAILNGTSNYILTNMREKGLAFEEVLKKAQELGYAEADPVNDVEGFDAFYKLMILSELSFGNAPDWEDVERKGITEVSSEQIEVFSRWGYKVKHLARIRGDRGSFSASVKPVLVDAEHPLYGVEDVQNAIMVETSLAGKVTVQGAGAGKLPTASAMVEDLTYVLQGHSGRGFVKKQPNLSADSLNGESVAGPLVGEYAVIGSSVGFNGSDDIQLLKQDVREDLVYLLIRCEEKTAESLSANSNLVVYEVAGKLKPAEVKIEEKDLVLQRVMNL
ncbi:homoserine dehydrogenase [Fictibacillus phosphorivorans]|uniref:homoserine dehydrogenase n=1 Tax=Fictibacillus phosphorivorans TaxID=1221500 RepID=UPI00203F2C12|nr:homoserine dehydrogenase [Fictibacillus phosphorivorans]MCM3717328.1 homoserine dehydrogenase [Fictibacillus phosphorivorans]MCM3775023.1 homoserine dehydrogenase [Fictibacillus phosphorivorans]